MNTFVGEMFMDKKIVDTYVVDRKKMDLCYQQKEKRGVDVVARGLGSVGVEAVVMRSVDRRVEVGVWTLERSSTQSMRVCKAIFQFSLSRKTKMNTLET